MPDSRTLCVSDLHLGKSERMARRGGGLLPPYETDDTLQRLFAVIHHYDPAQVICLGDSFDDITAADALPRQSLEQITTLQAGRRWVWIEGNHDPGPVSMGGEHLSDITIDNLAFRHIATDARAEVSGHYHPKHRIAGVGPTRPCFIYDRDRLIMPAFGTYTGGLSCTREPLSSLMDRPAIAVLTGTRAIAVPV